MKARSWTLLTTIALAVGAAVLTPAVGGCSGCQDDEVDAKLLASLTNEKGVQIGLKLDDAQREEAARLAGKVSNGRFAGRLVERERNARLFLFLAAKSDKPEIIRASLGAMGRAYVGRADRKSKKPVVDADYGTVVVAHLKSQDPKILSEALDASRPALEARPPNPAVLKEVTTIATSHPVAGARIEAINVLVKMPNYRRNPVVADAFLRILDDKSPAVVSHALYYLYQNGAETSAKRDAFLAKARMLFKHPDQGVRGRATKLAANLAPRDVAVRNEIRAMLDDPDPYVRSIVPHALVDMHDVAAIHLLIPKLKDLARNNHHASYAKLGGGEGAVAHGAKNETVHDTVARAIESLSAKLPEPFKRPGRKNDQASRDKNIPAAIAWYEKHKGELPALDADPAAAEPDKDKAGADKDKAGAKKAPEPAAAPKAAAPTPAAPKPASSAAH